jgi:hypothetical protein
VVASRVKNYHAKRTAVAFAYIWNLLGARCAVPTCTLTASNADLEINHINGGGSAHRNRHARYYSYLEEILAEIEAGSTDYELLCVPHHQEIHPFIRADDQPMGMTQEARFGVRMVPVPAN